MNQAGLKVIFAGTPDFAAQHLQALLNSQHQVIAVYSQPDRPAGRGRKLTASPVKALAVEHGIDVQQPLSLKDINAQQVLASYNADIMVVVAYGLLLPQAALDTPRLGCINVHGSLLPRWRGAAPIQRAILAGDAKSGVTIMQMEAGLDTGPMLLKAEIPIAPTDTSASLYEKLAILGCSKLIKALDNLQSSSATGLAAQVQNDAEASYATKLVKAEGAIDWHQSARQICLQVRGLNPWPVAYSDWQGNRLRIWLAHAIDTPSNQPAGTLLSLDKTGLEVACGTGRLKITQLQWPGGKTLALSELVNLKQKMRISDAFTSLKVDN
ncbi:MAG: methionyl-tRNA formyltransferase [Gammaproteobacteria bacterium]|nr:methionyl-tRNA formyltransferase [Gammaproteobacteria bacterium]